MMNMPGPTPQHQWLRQFVGEWESDVEIIMPDKTAINTNGAETFRMVGDFWVVGEGTGDMGDKEFVHRFTLGFDPKSNEYVGTWIDSMSSHLWQQRGSVDPAGKILTMKTEGACPENPGQLLQFREVTEFQSADHKIFTSSVQGPDGTFSPVVTVNSRRKSS